MKISSIYIDKIRYKAHSLAFFQWHKNCRNNSILRGFKNLYYRFEPENLNF